MNSNRFHGECTGQDNMYFNLVLSLVHHSFRDSKRLKFYVLDILSLCSHNKVVSTAYTNRRMHVTVPAIKSGVHLTIVPSSSWKTHWMQVFYGIANRID